MPYTTNNSGSVTATKEHRRTYCKISSVNGLNGIIMILVAYVCEFLCEAIIGLPGVSAQGNGLRSATLMCRLTVAACRQRLL